jgi:hypothetical protein
MNTYVTNEVEGTGAMNDAVGEPFPEDFEVKVLAELSRTVKHRVPQCALIIQVSLKHEGDEARPGGEEPIEESGEPVRVVDLPTEPGIVSEVHFAEDQDEILVEVVAYHLGDSYVAISPVHHQESLKELELTDGVVGRARRLGALLTSNAYANVCLRYHGYIVCAIPDGKSDVALLLFGEEHHISLLFGTYAAADHRLGTAPVIKELL